MIDTVNEIVAEIGASPAAVALAWIQPRPGITSTVSAPRLNFPAASNAAFARLAHNGGTTVDGVPTPVPPQLVNGARVY